MRSRREENIEQAEITNDINETIQFVTSQSCTLLVLPLQLRQLIRTDEAQARSLAF